MTGPKIAIIGGGPAGLLLARLLQHSSLACTVFELDADRHARTQGGTLDLHESTAQLALKEAGLYEKFLAHARPEGEVLKIYDASGTVLMDENEGIGVRRPNTMSNRPEIDRVLLRAMLLDSLVPGSVQWGMKLSRVEQVQGADNERTYDLHFTNGHVATGFDIIVGADGAWSKVRPLVTDAKPFYSGISGLDVKLSSANTRHPDLGKRTGGGMCLTLGPNKGILAQRNGDGAVRCYAFMRAMESWDQDSGIDFGQMETAKREFVARYFGDWDQGAKDMVLRSDADSSVVRHLFMLPLGLTWCSRPGIALIGDAAHLMTPFAGVGVNVAMEDALLLARAIVAAASQKKTITTRTDKSALAAALQKYDADMFVRAERYAQQTWMYLGLFFHERGGVAMVEHFERMQAQESAAAVTAAAALKEEVKASAPTTSAEKMMAGGVGVAEVVRAPSDLPASTSASSASSPVGSGTTPLMEAKVGPHVE